MRHPNLLSLFIVCFCLAHSTVFASMGPLEEFIEPGDDGDWQVELNANSLQLRNSDASGDLTYYYINSPPETLGNRTISVKLQVPYATNDSMAGILYGFESSSRTYYLFTIAGDRTINLIYRGENGFENQLKTSIDIGPDSTTSLKLVESGRQVSLYINEELTGQLESDRLGRGAVGIIAADIGNYQFSDFVISTPGDSSSSSRPSTQEPDRAPALKTRLQEYIDPRTQMVQRWVPLPDNWQLDDNPNDTVILRGPNDIVSYHSDSGHFIDSPDSSLLQAARIGGAQTVPLMTVDEYLRQYYAQGMVQNGFQLTDSFPMPKIQQFWELFGAGMPQGLSEKHYEAMGVEWAHANGNRAFTILVLNVFRRPNSTLWHVGASEIYADAQSYEMAKNVMIHASVNTEMNPDWQIAMNNRLLQQLKKIAQEGGERMRQSQVAHIGRMNAILERGKASREFARINSDIIDSSHSSYLNTSNMVARSNERFRDMISERSVIANPDTGELYKVDAGYSNHWVSTDGLHLPTDNALYDPRTDPDLNDREWTQFELMR